MTRIDVKLKLSQNRSRDDRERVIDGLAAEGYAEASATAAWMRDLRGGHVTPRSTERARARLAQQRRNADRSRMRSGLW